MLNFLESKLSLEEIERLERKLNGVRAEEINREYWEEVFLYPYNLSKKDEVRITEEYYITILEEV